MNNNGCPSCLFFAFDFSKKHVLYGMFEFWVTFGCIVHLYCDIFFLFGLLGTEISGILFWVKQNSLVTSTYKTQTCCPYRPTEPPSCLRITEYKHKHKHKHTHTNDKKRRRGILYRKHQTQTLSFEAKICPWFVYDWLSHLILLGIFQFKLWILARKD